MMDVLYYLNEDQEKVMRKGFNSEEEYYMWLEENENVEVVKVKY